jgi:hypothetical protein
MYSRIIQGKVLSCIVDEEFDYFVADLNQDDLTLLASLAGEGKMTSVIDRSFTLDQVPAAIEYLAGWHARGKVVVRVPPDSTHSQNWKPTPTVVSNVFNESSKRSMTLSR